MTPRDHECPYRAYSATAALTALVPAVPAAGVPAQGPSWPVGRLVVAVFAVIVVALKHLAAAWPRWQGAFQQGPGEQPVKVLDDCAQLELQQLED